MKGGTRGRGGENRRGWNEGTEEKKIKKEKGLLLERKKRKQRGTRKIERERG